MPFHGTFLLLFIYRILNSGGFSGESLEILHRNDEESIEKSGGNFEKYDVSLLL